MPAAIGWTFPSVSKDPDKPKATPAAKTSTPSYASDPLFKSGFYTKLAQGSTPQAISAGAPLGTPNTEFWMGAVPSLSKTFGTSIYDQSGAGGGGGGYYYGGGGGGGTGGRKVKYTPTYTMEGAPSWWMGMTPTALTGESAYFSLMNAMIPYMSPEDQRSTATYLSTVLPDYFARYYDLSRQQKFSVQNENEFNKWMTTKGAMKKDAEGNYVVSDKRVYEIVTKQLQSGALGTNVPGLKFEPAKAGELPSEVTTEHSQYFQSSDRAQQALSALDTLVKAVATRTKKPEAKTRQGMGAGYQFLSSVLKQMQEFGGEYGQGQKRRQNVQMLGQLDPLLALAESSAYGAYKPIAQKLTQPFFSAGYVTPTTKAGSRTAYGSPNLGLF